MNLGQVNTGNRVQSHYVITPLHLLFFFYLLGPSVLVFGPFRVTDISNLSLFSMIIWAIGNYSRYFINPCIYLVPSPPFNFIVLLTTSNIFLKIVFKIVRGALDEPAPTYKLKGGIPDLFWSLRSPGRHSQKCILNTKCYIFDFLQVWHKCNFRNILW